MSTLLVRQFVIASTKDDSDKTEPMSLYDVAHHPTDFKAEEFEEIANLLVSQKAKFDGKTGFFVERVA